MMDFITGIKQWWGASEPPKLHSLVSFDIRGKLKRVVEVYGITNRGGVTYKADHNTPDKFLEYTRHCMVTMDFGLQWKDCVKFVYFDSELTLVIDRGVVCVPAHDERYVTYGNQTVDLVTVAKPTEHYSGVIPETPGLLLVHPSWGGSPTLLVTTQSDPLPVTL